MERLQTRTWREISLANLEHNYRALRALLPQGCRFLGVVKANAYGNGAVPVARRLEELGGVPVMDDFGNLTRFSDTSLQALQDAGFAVADTDSIRYATFAVQQAGAGDFVLDFETDLGPDAVRRTIYFISADTYTALTGEAAPTLAEGEVVVCGGESLPGDSGDHRGGQHEV